MGRTFAVVLALLCIVSLPAFGQGTVRSHGHTTGGPPAPTPTVDRDQRNRVTDVREDDPKQWEVRGPMQHCMRMMISNLRRAQASDRRPSMLTPTYPQYYWSNDGGDWGVVTPHFYIPFSPCVMGSGNATYGAEPFALYSDRKGRYLNTRLTWDTAPQYVWKLNGRHARKPRNGVGYYTRFALFNVDEGRYLMLCRHDDPDARKRNEQLCYYNVPL
jgi:hypothetical protein